MGELRDHIFTKFLGFYIFFVFTHFSHAIQNYVHCQPCANCTKFCQDNTGPDNKFRVGFKDNNNPNFVGPFKFFNEESQTYLCRAGNLLKFQKNFNDACWFQEEGQNGGWDSENEELELEDFELFFEI